MFLKAKFELGPRACAEVATDPDTGSYALRLKLDPGVMVITAAAGPNGPRDLATFMSALSRETALLAVALDPTLPAREVQANDEVPVQGTLTRWFSQSGAGGFGPEVGQ